VSIHVIRINRLMTHRLPSDWLDQAVRVDLIGAGGNGSQMLTALARIHVSWRALGHPEGLQVTLWDPDEVTVANVGRQMFAPTDIGQPKAHVLVNRVNAFWGLHWQARASDWKGTHASLLIGCVDSIKARREIHHQFRRCNIARYWLDLGNDAHTGQVVLGESTSPYGYPERLSKKNVPLPTVCELFPELLTRRKEDNAPSCSLAGALARQDLFINQHVTTWAASLLWQLLHHGGIEHHGYFVNIQSGRVMPLKIDRQEWERLGYAPWKPRPLKRIVKVVKPRGSSLFDRATVRLACGHVTRSNGAKKARCPKCK
jgi:PRTRC genetic system ThiF family protein